MGCQSPRNANSPNVPAQYYNRWVQVAQISHPFNVNKKYQHIAKINESLQVGQDFKKTYAYDCITTKQDLHAKRKQFWQTRVNGNPNVWNTLRIVVNEPNLVTGKSIMDQNKISMLNNSIQLCWDTKNNRYEIPVFCINQPLSYSDVAFMDKNLQHTYEDKELEIRIRSTKFPNQDINLKQFASTPIQTLKNTVKALKNLDQNTKIRLFYGGRQLADDKSLGNYKFDSGLVIQALIQ